jgi:GTP-binding protein Era
VSRAGFVALAGRPNVGKSTLVNAVVGAKVAIVSDRPQTTRRAIRGVHRGAGSEIVFVDLPGVQRPRDPLTERMAHRVQAELDGADAALMVVNAEQGIGPGDRFIARSLGGAGIPVTIAVNKVDRVGRASLLQVLAEAAALDVGDAVFPISARRGDGLGELLEHLRRLMPEGPFSYGPDTVSDQPREVQLAELVREAVIRRTREEIPHAVEVAVDEIDEVREGLVRVRASVWVESESQKGILIGAGGRMVKAVGTAARKEMERLLGTRVHLDLAVRVRRGWRADDGLLDRLGID